MCNLSTTAATTYSMPVNGSETSSEEEEEEEEDEEEDDRGYSFGYPDWRRLHFDGIFTHSMKRTNRLEDSNEFPCNGGVLRSDEVFLTVLQQNSFADDGAEKQFWAGLEELAMEIGSLPNIKLLYLVHARDEFNGGRTFKGDLRIEAMLLRRVWQIVTLKWTVYAETDDLRTALHVEDMAAVMSQHPCLENFLVLYGEEVNAMLTGQQVFQDALLAMPGLRQYNFCEVLDEAHIMKLLCQPSFSTLVIHEFSSDLDMTFDAVFKAIASEKSSVTRLEIKKNLNDQDKFATKLVKALECNKSLKVVSLAVVQLSFNDKEIEVGTQLIQALLRNVHLQRIEFKCLRMDSNNNLEEETDVLKVVSICKGLLKMNRAGRKYILDDQINQAKGVEVLAAVRSKVDCLFLHLIENPFLCHREAKRKISS